jgi:hypothetical protein
MASTGKRKTTMAKLNRERKLLERRMEKKVRKEARKRAAAEGAVNPGAADEAPDSVAADESEVRAETLAAGRDA